MNKHTTVSVLAGAMLLVGFVYLVRNRPQESTSSNAQGVTSGTKGDLKTTPIQSTLAFAASSVNSVLSAASSLLANAGATVQSIAQHNGQDKLESFGNERSAEAAYTAPLRPEYKVSTLAKNNVVYLPYSSQ